MITKSIERFYRTRSKLGIERKLSKQVNDFLIFTAYAAKYNKIVIKIHPVENVYQIFERTVVKQYVFSLAIEYFVLVISRRGNTFLHSEQRS